MSHSFLEIIDRTGKPRYVRVGAESVMVGSGAHAQVRLPAGGHFAPEHMIFNARVGGHFVRVPGFRQMPALFQGQTFQEGFLPWGSEVEVAGLRIRILETLPEELRGTSAISPFTWVVAGLMIAAFVAVVAIPASGPGIANTATKPPALFATEYGCPAGSSPAHYQGLRWADAAIAKSERYPFAPEEGVESVRLFRQSEKCFAASDDAPRALLAKEKGDAMQSRVEHDYRARLLRLERALRNDRPKEALGHAMVLRDLLHDSKDSYVVWLDTLQRMLRQRVTASASEL